VINIGELKMIAMGIKNNAASLARKQEKPYIRAQMCAYIYRGE
jgi:hypothetical protein